ncbi:MAG: YdjY domain-containing protein [Thermoguttaceae bacterium]|jgi:hypothetical protein
MRVSAVVGTSVWFSIALVLPLFPCAQAVAQDNDQPAAEKPKPADLGSPLVDDPASLVRLDPTYPVWIDKRKKEVVFLAQVCRADYPLEFLVTLRDRSYEAVVATDVRPSLVHAGLLAVGAKPGHPANYKDKFIPPTGTEVAIEFRWKDSKGKVQHAPAHYWVRNVRTKKALDVNWVFGGSGFTKDETTGKQYYLGDSGDFISVLNLPTATLDLPIQSTSALESRLFEGFVEHLPPEKTPVTVILIPVKLAKAGSVRSGL